MMRAFTRNYEDNSSEAGFQFTFYCDICNDGYKSNFIESETYKRGKGLRGISQGLGMLGSLVGGVVGDIGYSAERGGHILSENFQGQSPEWNMNDPLPWHRMRRRVIFIAATVAIIMLVTLVITKTRDFVPSAHLARRSM